MYFRRFSKLFVYFDYMWTMILICYDYNLMQTIYNCMKPDLGWQKSDKIKPVF